jgi:hypothetical protein
MSGPSSTYVLDVAGRQLLIGGAWHLADNAAEAKAIRSEVERGSVSYELKHEAAISVAVYTLPAKVQLRADAVSGGAALALAAPNVFVCQHLDATHCWVFAALKGQPLPGIDSVVRSADVAHMLADATVSGAEMTMVGDVPGVESIPLEALLATVEPGTWLRAQLKVKRAWLKPAVGAAVVVAAVGIAALLRAWLPTPEAPVLALQASHASAPAATVPAVAASVPALPAPAAAPEGPIRYATVPSIQAVLAAIRDLPTSVNGWAANGVACKVAEHTCQVTWVASPGATPSGASQIPGVDLPSTGPVTKVVTSRVPVAFASTGTVHPLDASETLSLYSSDTSFLAEPDVFTLTVSAADRLTNQEGAPVARVLAFGPLWAWERLAAVLQRTGITAETVTLGQLDSSEPQIRVSATAFSHSAPKPAEQVSTGPLSAQAQVAAAVPAVAPR